jgi:hypothetical protein
MSVLLELFNELIIFITLYRHLLMHRLSTAAQYTEQVRVTLFEGSAEVRGIGRSISRALEGITFDSDESRGHLEDALYRVNSMRTSLRMERQECHTQLTNVTRDINMVATWIQPPSEDLSE